MNMYGVVLGFRVKGIDIGDLIPEILKARTRNGAFWRSLKRCFGIWNCWESFLNRRKKKMLFICQLLKTRSLNCAFWRYLKQYFGTFDNKNIDSFFFFGQTEQLKTRTLNVKWCIRTVFKTMFWSYWEHLETKDTILALFGEVGTAQNCLKSWTIYGAFWRYLKRGLGSWNWLEKGTSKDAKCCILTLFEEYGAQLLGELVNVENIFHH